MIKLWIIFILTIIIFNQSVQSRTISNYSEQRNSLLASDHNYRFGNDLIHHFSPKEIQVNTILKRVREEELHNGIRNPETFAPGMHFFKAKPLIESSKVFKFIEHMPKGALLHGHNTAMVSSDWVLKNTTYRTGMNMCYKETQLILTFKQNDSRCETELISVAEKRENATNINEFDKNLKNGFDLYTPTPEIDYPNINKVWKKFQGIFGTLYDVIRYLPIFYDYHNQLLQELYDDNVMYAEIRTSFGVLYDDDGKNYKEIETAGILYKIVQDFRRTHPKFGGVKFIYGVYRGATNEQMQVKIDLFKELHEKYPNFVIGFDLVGQEDMGKPLKHFLKQFHQLPNNTKFFFHAGETNWYGTEADNNLFDAILLKTQRIGHGYSLYKHPVLWEKIKKLKIGIELLPISNQVLGLVYDLRNHPGAFYIAENLPIVISSDDPGYWNAKGLSYDFYYAFMAIAPFDAGLEVLKQFALNSLSQSVLSNHERHNINLMFDDEWNKFLDAVIDGNII